MGNIKLLNIENIIVKDDISSKKEVLDLLSKSLLASKSIDNIESFIGDILEREGRGSTFVGQYMAIPHGLSSNVNRPAIALMKLNNEMFWDPDKNPVKLIFLFAIPKDEKLEAEAEFLKTLPLLLGDEVLVDKLLEARSEEELLELINTYRV